MKVGQKVFLKSLDSRDGDIKEVTVSKVGRKYFQVEEMYNTRFSIEEMLDDAGKYTSRWKVYPSMREIEDERESYELHNKIKQQFSTYRPNYSLETLREIYRILMGIY